MPRKGENIYKRKDGRWEGRFIKQRTKNNKAIYGYVYGKSYSAVLQSDRFIAWLNRLGYEKEMRRMKEAFV